MNEDMTRLMRMNQNLQNNNESFDIRKKRISILDTYGENFN